MCKVEHESASAVGVFYRGIFLRADSGTLSAPRTRMHIIDASVRSPEAFSPEALSARNTEEERRSSEVEPPPVTGGGPCGLAVAVAAFPKGLAVEIASGWASLEIDWRLAVISVISDHLCAALWLLGRLLGL